MRESQKMRLDIALHTKIIDSIICIQRWFRSILQRRKYLMYRSAACTIQSYWRSHLSDKFTFKIRTEGKLFSIFDRKNTDFSITFVFSCCGHPVGVEGLFGEKDLSEAEEWSHFCSGKNQRQSCQSEL